MAGSDWMVRAPTASCPERARNLCRRRRVRAPYQGASSTCRSLVTGRRGGIHSSVTRLLGKALIGGYAQLSYTFNYLGPTGNQRDIVSTIRRRSQEVQF